MKKVVIISCIGLIILGGVWYVMGRSVETSAVQNPVATVILSTEEEFKIELYPEDAPNTVANFIALAESGFYDQTYMNRILPGFLVQAGDPIGNGYGFPGYFIKSECKYNGYTNRLKHTKGTVSMARGREFDTEGSQFFVLLKDASELNGQYAAFGRIIEGMDVVDALGNMGVKGDYTPVNPVWIEAIHVETYGQSYGEPAVLSIQEQRASAQE
ncbi:MAG: peptidylprolyl isomerase [Cellulosilyticaceae bacterium]